MYYASWSIRGDRQLEDRLFFCCDLVVAWRELAARRFHVGARVVVYMIMYVFSPDVKDGCLL